MIEELRGEGTTILLTTQYLEEADRLAQTIAVIDHGRIVAEGTGHELKERVGRDRLVLRPSPPERVADAAGALARIAGDGGPDVSDDGEISLPVPAPDVPAAAIRALDAIGVGVAAIEVRSPTLDEVFLAFTGRRVEEDQKEAA
jgi:ABC-type multidrug transport system ATPase subunit